jgi:putative intracellular protease/amidase
MTSRTKVSLILFALLLLSIIVFNGWKSIKILTKSPEQYGGENTFNWQTPAFDASKKNVFIVANATSTELFDMIAPFYLFNATGQSNVYVVAEHKSPIQIKDKLYALPHFTFNEIDALKLHADVIVIPFLGVIDTNQNPVIVNWIRSHYSETTKILSICDGAATAASTGLYDGKPLTCNAKDYATVTPYFRKPHWVQQVRVTHSGNLYSTAGVSNAVEGSLMVIQDLFGTGTMHDVMTDIHYKYPEIRVNHESMTLNTKAVITILKKVFFGKNQNIGVLLQNGADELQLAAILDVYSQTFPAGYETHILNGTTIRTKFGLTLVSTQNNDASNVDELHVLHPKTLTKEESGSLKEVKVVSYDNSLNEYPFDVCLNRIAAQYGKSFARVAGIMLDYNYGE